MPLLAYPNVSEGRDAAAIAQIGEAFGDGLLDVHSDPITTAARSRSRRAGRAGPRRRPGRGASGAADPHRRARGSASPVGAIDVAPIIFLGDADRGAACAEALVLADMLAEDVELPVFLYGILAAGRTRAQLRRGGPAELARRITAGELAPDFGPPRLHPTAGAILVAARPPLVAFNVELAPPATLDDARRIAALIREGGEEGHPGLRAIGLWLDQHGLAQVSTNVEDHRATPLAAVVAAVKRHARWPAPSSSASRPRPRLTGSRTTSKSAVTRRSKIRCTAALTRRKLHVVWHRPSASAGPSTAATPPARLRFAAAPAARRLRRSARSRNGPSAPGRG